MSSTAPRLLAPLVAAVGLLFCPAGLQAQRALVYCPVTIDATGCNAVVAALGADPSPFPGGVDTGFDGTSGTVDLASGDLSGYSVLVIPSLADGGGAAPYALLRDATVGPRVRSVFVGRLAAWSGSPDIGTTNRAAKNGLIRNLAVFARADSANTHGPGLVVLQDNSDDGAARYDWLAGISGVAVTADTTFEFYSNVDVLTPTGRGILTNTSGLQIGYTNMASFGLVPPADGTPVSRDARGGRTTRLVLLTTAGEPGAPIATVITDREDYPPGDTVVVTGSGWEPGETVRMLLHEDPAVHNDRTLTAVADSAGNIFNNSFVLAEDDLGVRFVLTAVGLTSGRTAQATFTDARVIQSATINGAASVAVVAGQAITAVVNVTTDGSGNNSRWRSTGWRIAATAPGTVTCVDHVNHDNAGNSSETFTITAPGTASPPAFNVYFIAYSDDVCSAASGGGAPSATFILNNAVTVAKGNTSTVLTSSPNPSVFGGGVTFTATVSPSAPAGGTPTGTVTFKEGAVTLGSGTLACAATCTATFTSATLAVGSHSLTAQYAGDAGYNGSTSAALTHAVNKTNTITTVTGPTTSVFGQTFTFNATVSGGGVGTPTGQVQFRVDGTNLSTAVSLSGGTATSPTVSGLTLGAHNLTAEYLGDPSFNGSLSGPFAHTVGKAATTTAITADTPDPSSPGQVVSVSFTVAAVAPGAGTPTGTVTVSASGGAETCNGTAAAGSCSITLTTSGSRTLTASYAGDGNFTGSTSGGATHTVTAAATSLAVAPASGTVGGTVALSATLTGAGNPVPGVSVNFTLNGTVAGSGTTNGSGTATVAAASLGTIDAGTYTTGVGANFAGTATFTSSSGTASLTVGPKPTTLTLQGTPTSVVYGSTATFGAKLSENGAGRAITLLIDGSPVGSDVTNSGGNAMITVNFASLPAIGVGPHTVQASFAGETNLQASTSATANFNVTAAAATVTLSNLAKTYDGTPKSATVTTSPAGLSVAVTYGGSATPPTDAGSYAVIAIVTNANYTGSGTGTLVIAPLTVTGHFTAGSKVYDGTNAATILTRTLTGSIVSGDVVSLTGGTAAFDNKNVGTGKTVTGTGFALSGADQANYVLASTTLTTTADITRRTLTVTATAQSKAYDGTTAAIVTLSDDRVVGDVFTVNRTSATFADKSVGTGKIVTVGGLSLTGTDGGNYTLAATSVTTTADITALTLAPQFTADDKVYDGTTDATILTRSASGTVIAGDKISVVGGTAQFDTRHAGTGKTVTGSGFSLDGDDAANYLLNPTTAATTATISRRPITATATADTKIYDGTTSSSATPAVTTGSVVEGDEKAFTQAFDTKLVGTGKTLTPAGSVTDGNGGADYLVTFAENHTGVIQAKTLVASITAQNKTYDGTDAAIIATRSLVGVVGTEDVGYVDGSATFEDRNAGTGKTVTATGLSLSGVDAGNYTVNPTASTTADINRRPLEVTAAADTKTYDGMTASDETPTISDGTIAGADTPSFTQSFDTKAAGNGKTLTPAGSVTDGNGGANYQITFIAVHTGIVSPRTLVVTASAQSRPYDGTTAAVVSLSDDRLGGDVFAVNHTAAAFDTKAVGSGKTVTVGGLSLTGTDAGNYALAATSVMTTADITALTLAPQFTAADKVYDGTTDATILTRSASGTIIGGDKVAVAGGSAEFDTRHAGTVKTVTGTGFSLDGEDAVNYLLNPTSAATTASITRRPITVTAAPDTKTYDGTTSSSATPTVTTGSIATGDEGAFTQTFDTRHVGTGKTLTPAGAVSDDNGGANYLVTLAENHTGVIQAKALIGSITAEDKTYDGTDAAAIATRSLVGVVGTEHVSYVGGTATFDDRNAGSGKSVTALGLSLDGADAGNYTVNSAAATTANIARRPIQVIAVADSKTYDGTTASDKTPTISSGTIVSGDTPNFTQAFDTKAAGTGKALAPNGAVTDGNAGANYLVTLVAVHTGTIAPRALAVTATAEDKVYDGTTAATVSLSDDRLAGDVFVVHHTTSSFDTKKVGTGKTVTVSGLSLTGDDAGNYQLGSTTVTATADITPVTLAAHFTAGNKVYDGTAAATILTRTLSGGVIAGDYVAIAGGTASFSDKNAGLGKTVTANGFTLTGGDAGNYLVDPSPATATADITVRTLAVTATGQTRVYDATQAAMVTLHDDRVMGDLLSVSHAPATFGDKNVGSNKTITVPGIAITGTDAGNYQLASTSITATADITPASLQPAITVANKVYDGNASATILTRSVTGVLLSDGVALDGGTATFANANAGPGKSVTGSGFTLTGTDATNYVLNPATAQTTATIDRRPIAVTANAGQSKVYGTTPDPELTWQITAGSLVAGESLTGSLTRALGETVAGSPYAITQGTLTGGPNYDLSFTSAGFAITRATLTVTAANASKTYGDALPALTGTIMGAKFSDNISASYTAYVAVGGITLVTATTPVAGSPYPIIPLVSGSPSGVLANYTVVPVNGNLTVNKATPAFTGVAIPNVVFGQSTGMVSGTVRYAGTGSSVVPSGSVTVTVNGQSGTGTILADGTFSASVATTALPASGTGHTVTLTYNGSDPNFLSGSGTGVMKVLYNTSAGHQFLQPINPNLTTGNRSSFKIGSTIPTKFQLLKADGTTVVTTAVATIAVVKIDNNAETPVNEDMLTTPADNGTTFRLSSGQYIYNLGTKNWTAGTYRIIASLDDGSQITAEVDGRAK
jgi:hypothetical protein